MLNLNNQKKYIIFDFDGTLADNFEDITNFLYKHKINKKLNYTKEKIRYLLKEKSLLELIKETKISKIKLIFYFFIIKRDFEKKRNNFKIFNEIKETLYQLKSQNYTLGIITSNEKKFVDKFLKKYEINFFNFKYYNTNFFKKDKILKKIIKKNKLNTNNIYYIGDSVRDIKAAQKTNIKSIAVTWGYNSKNLLEKQNPTYIINSPKEILAVTKKN